MWCQTFLLRDLWTAQKKWKAQGHKKFDASFFGVHPKQAHTMDPQLRLLLEVSYEAILDGGKKMGD